MKLSLKKAFMLVFLFFVAVQAFATHNRAGEIVYKHIKGYTYKIIIYTYCYTQTEADRDELELDCGDGTGKMTLKRISKTSLDDNESLSFSFLCKNVYEGEHTFSGPGTYVLYMEDPNRNDGVANIPNSVNVVFALKTTLIISPLAIQNSSPILLNPPMDKAALNRTFVHNPGAYDPDGDSLSYKIAVCLQQDAQEIIGYSLPPVTDTIYVNPETGDFVWDKPSRVGVYNVAMWIEEWRDKIMISRVLRDIQVEVIDIDNHTPVIDKQANYCVLAGNNLNFNVTASDPDGNRMLLSASGGPLAVTESPATFTTLDVLSKSPVGVFDWNTINSHVRRQPYNLLVKCVDDDARVSLTAYQTINITVIAPKPEITSITPTNSSISLTWNNGGNTNATGYKLYRSNRPVEYNQGACQTGLPSSAGYELIAEFKDPSILEYVDNNGGLGLPEGFCYCYRLTAVFADGAESQVSDEVSALLPRGLVLFTKASVDVTDEKEGKISLEWIGPKDLDEISVPPPYYYLLFPGKAEEGGITNEIYGGSINLEGYDNTKYQDKKLDTEKRGAVYKVCFANFDVQNKNYNSIGSASSASTVFLKLHPSDRRVTLTYDCDVPWCNDKFEVYRKDPGKETFEYLATTNKDSYTDYNLINGQTYGYKIKTIGFFSEEGLPTNIENFSQEAYATPIDTIAPCVKCKVKSYCTEIYNRITWQPDTACGLGIEKYFLYYSETLDGKLNLLETFTPDVNHFDHYPELGMAGCYAVSALDSAGNQGVVSERICVDECEYYRLPNVFTPNDDGKNDLFHPYPYQFVDRIDMVITNRWGEVVYTTTDPDINWDGCDKNTGKLVPDGVYYYKCIVYEHRLTGIEPKDLEGFITIFSRKTKN